jgi:hypothetical protein
MKKAAQFQVPTRFYKVKDPYMKFFCPLCKTPRQMKNSPRMSFKNYMQILLVSTILCMLLFPLMKERVFFIPFVCFGVMEVGKRFSWRNEISCPHCGFDAKWYKKNVKIAKERVLDFWAEKEELKSQLSLDKIEEKAEIENIEQKMQSVEEHLEPVQDQVMESINAKTNESSGAALQ